MRTSTIVERAAGEFATDIRNGLTKPGQKELPSKYLYDTIGSKLFEVIAELPEYGVTRADERLIRGHARNCGTHRGRCDPVRTGKRKRR